MSALLAAAAAAALLVVLKVRKSRVEEIRIAELLIYPIKCVRVCVGDVCKQLCEAHLPSYPSRSCGGTSVSQAVVTTTGFRDGELA